MSRRSRVVGVFSCVKVPGGGICPVASCWLFAWVGHSFKFSSTFPVRSTNPCERMFLLTKYAIKLPGRSWRMLPSRRSSSIHLNWAWTAPLENEEGPGSWSYPCQELEKMAETRVNQLCLELLLNYIYFQPRTTTCINTKSCLKWLVFVWSVGRTTMIRRSGNASKIEFRPRDNVIINRSGNKDSDKMS